MLGMSTRVKKVVTPPINQVFRYLQTQQRVQVTKCPHATAVIWLSPTHSLS